jgi:hypothetical protein
MKKIISFVMLLAFASVCFATTPTPPNCPTPTQLGSAKLTGVVTNTSSAVAASDGVGEAFSSNTAQASLTMISGVTAPTIPGGVAPTINLSVETGASGASLTTSTGNGTSLGQTTAHAAGLVLGSVAPKVDGVGSLPMNGGVSGLSDITTKAVNAQDSSGAAASKATLVASGTISLVDGIKTIATQDVKTSIAQVNTAGAGLQTANALGNAVFSTKPITLSLPKL